VTAAPDSIDYRRFKFTLYAETHSEEESPEELFDTLWEDLNERRRQKACARCGWFVSCKIQQITRYHKYKILPFWQLKPNSIEKNVKGDICIPCGEELVGGMLGTSSKRTQHLSNRKEVEHALRLIEYYMAARKCWNREYVRLCHRIERIKNSRIDIENPQQMIDDLVMKIECRKGWVKIVEGKIDRMVSVYNLK
jgi:hypothetical protein